MTDLRDQLRTYFDSLTDDVLAGEVTPTPRRGRSRGPWIAAAAAIVVVALVAGLLALARDSGDDGVHVAGIDRTVVQLVGYGDGTDYQDLVFADPATGTTHRITTNGSCFCALVVLDGTIWGHDHQGVFRVDPPYTALTRVDAEPGALFPTLDGTGLWVASGRVGAVSVRRIDTKTNDVGPRIPMPTGSLVTDHPASEVVGGILIFSDGYPRSLSIWNPDTGALRELAANVGNLGSTYTANGARSSQVVYRDAQQKLQMVDTASGRTVPITVNGEAVRGIGGGAFSPDGKTVAAFVNVSTSDNGGVQGGRIAQLMLVDAATGVGRVIEHDPVEFGEEYGWATWAPDGSRVFFGAGGPAYGVGLHETRATPLAVASNYTWTALDVPAPPDTEPAPTPAPDVAAGQLGQPEWQRIPKAFADNTFVQGVAAGPDGFVAVGLEFDPAKTVNDPTTAAIWTSEDGARFTRVPGAELPDGGNDVRGVAFWRGAYWAVVKGSDENGIWRSVDGRSWKLVKGIALMDPAGIHGGEHGLLVSLWNAPALFSTDGEAWAQADLPAGVVSGRIDVGTLTYVLTPTRPAGRRNTMWSSSDGIHWSPGADLGADVDPGGTALTSWNGALWATAFTGNEHRRAQLWRSIDGNTWQPVETDQGDDSTFDTLTVFGPYLVASGFADAQGHPGAWVTRDGEHWVPTDLERPMGGRLNLVAADGRVVIALSTSENKDVYRWTGAMRAAR